MSKEKIVRRSISMYEKEWEVVEEVSQQYRLANLSAAMRIIVSQHDQQKTCHGGGQHHEQE